MKNTRFDFRQTDAAVDAGKIFTEGQLFLTVDIDRDQTFPQFQRRLQGLGQPPGNAVFYDDPVDDRFDRVFFIPVQLDFFRQFTGFAIDPYPDIAILANLIQDFQMLAFLPGSPAPARSASPLLPAPAEHPPSAGRSAG